MSTASTHVERPHQFRLDLLFGTLLVGFFFSGVVELSDDPVSELVCSLCCCKDAGGK